jgi:hypothetical protein
MQEIFNLTLYFQIGLPEICDNLIETPHWLNDNNKESSETKFEENCKFLTALHRVFIKAKIKLASNINIPKASVELEILGVTQSW